MASSAAYCQCSVAAKVSENLGEMPPWHWGMPSMGKCGWMFVALDIPLLSIHQCETNGPFAGVLTCSYHRLMLVSGLVISEVCVAFYDTSLTTRHMLTRRGLPISSRKWQRSRNDRASGRVYSSSGRGAANGGKIEVLQQVAVVAEHRTGLKYSKLRWFVEL